MPLNSAQQAQAALASIFLNSGDNFVEMVPGYWKSCLKGANVRFSTEIQAVPGVSSSAASPQEPSPEEATSATLYRVGSGVTAPRVLFQQDPVFDQEARAAGFAGVVTLQLVVSQKGVPTNIRVAGPLGYGLDAKAVEAVQRWRFEPSKKDGEPVPVEIAVEVEFHL